MLSDIWFNFKVVLWWNQKLDFYASKLLSMLFLKHTRMHLAFTAVKAYCWLMVSLSIRKTESFSIKLFLNQSASRLYWWLELLFTRCGPWPFPLSNFMRFLPAHSSGLSGSPWISEQLYSLSATSFSFISPVNLLRVYSVPLSRSLQKMLKSIFPIIIPWGTSLMTEVQVVLLLLVTRH